jgi:hypothetical protein
LLWVPGHTSKGIKGKGLLTNWQEGTLYLLAGPGLACSISKIVASGPSGTECARRSTKNTGSPPQD